MVSPRKGTLFLFAKGNNMWELSPMFIDWYISILKQCTTQDRGNPVNLIDVVSYTCGWKPLEVWEEMTVSYDGKRYVIARVE